MRHVLIFRVTSTTDRLKLCVIMNFNKDKGCLKQCMQSLHWINAMTERSVAWINKRSQDAAHRLRSQCEAGFMKRWPGCSSWCVRLLSSQWRGEHVRKGLFSLTKCKWRRAVCWQTLQLSKRAASCCSALYGGWESSTQSQTGHLPSFTANLYNTCCCLTYLCVFLYLHSVFL